MDKKIKPSNFLLCLSEDQNGIYHFINSAGDIVTKDELTVLIDVVRPFFEIYEDETIISFNEDRYNRQKRYSEEQNDKPVKNKKPGVVYFLRYGGSNKVKIGYSRNLKNRISALNSKSPEVISLIGYIETNDPERMEKGIHKAVVSKLVKGEWYDFTDEEIYAFCKKNNLRLELFLWKQGTGL